MATYYKYKSREGKDIVDWSAITKGITDDINRIAGDREQQRVDIDNAVLTNLENIANKPQGAYSKENDRISSYAAQASAIALANQKLLKSGAISLKEYNSRTNTGLSSTKKLFTLSKQYQDNYEEGMKRLQSIDGKPPVGSEIEAMLMGSVERFGPPGSTDYYIDPITGEAFLASTIKDGDPNSYENTKIIDGVNKSLMSVGTAEGIINRQVDRYQSDAQATRIAKSLGTRIEVLQATDPNIKTKEDVFARMYEKTKDGKTVLSEFGKAVNKSIEASMVTDMSKASMLIDTMGADGYYMYTKNDDGTFTDLRTNTRMDSIPDKNLGIEMFVDNSGAYQPRLTEDQEKAAIDGVRDMIRTKLDIKETAGKGPMSEYEKEQIRLGDERIKLGYAQLGKKEEESRDIIGQIIQQADKDFDNLLDDKFTKKDGKANLQNIESRFQEKLAPILSKYNVKIEQADISDPTEVNLIIGDKKLNIDLYDNYNNEFISNEDLKKLIKDFVILNSSNESLIKTFKLLPANTTQQKDPGGGAGKFNK
tara:strand:- start:1182 stop:2789 length:1608 start_codon:yes stop_codon:yes gene_type:complete